MIRLVLDTSVVVATVCSRGGGASAVVVAGVEAGTLALLVSADIEAEYRRVIGYDRVRERARVDPVLFVDRLCQLAERVEPASVDVAVDDPDDRPILAAALGGRATHLLSFNVPDFLPPAEARALRLQPRPHRAIVLGIAVLEPMLFLRELPEP